MLPACGPASCRFIFPTGHMVGAGILSSSLCKITCNAFFFWYPWTSMAPNTMNKVFLFCCCCYYPPSFASGHSCGACYPRTRFMPMACLWVPLWAISKHTCLVNYVEVSLGCYDLWEGLLYYVWIDDERNLDWDEIADKFENCDLRKHYRRGRVKMRDVYVERFYELEISCGALRINYQF